MKYDFEAVDTHHSTVTRITSSMATNYHHIQSLQRDLIAAGFTGAGASGFDQVMSALNAKLTSYGDAVTRLGNTIRDVGGKSGMMDITDTNNGKGFLAI